MFQPLCVTIIGLTLLFHSAKGTTRQIIVEENFIYSNPYHDVWNSPNDSSTCCVTGDCICRSFFLALNNLTSNTILGHNSPTVFYNYNGALEFLHCKTIKIEGVSWNGCGNNTGDYNIHDNYNDNYYESSLLNGTDDYDFDPDLYFHDQEQYSVAGIHFQSSSSISFSLCTFQHFVGQAIKLMNVSECINISSCSFINNSYAGDGAAIYVAEAENAMQMLLYINETYFGINGPAKSIVYLHGHRHQMSAYKHTLISNSRFSFNQATPLFLIDEIIHVSGNILFEENVAYSGAAISSISSNIIFDENCFVGFYKNITTAGGAIYLLNHSIVSFASNTTVHFFDNTALYGGGAIFSDYYSEIIFEAKSNASFVNNTASMDGVLYSGLNSNIKFKNNSFVQFVHNTAEGQIPNNKGCTGSCGGAIFQESHSTILFSAKSLALFTNNDATQSGGAVHSYNYSEVIIEGKTLFINNTSQFGGALYFNSTCVFKFKGNVSVEFDGNVAISGGGAIVCYSNCSITFQQLAIVRLTGNSAEKGGAISCGLNCDISFKQFNNTAVKNGGAINLFTISTVNIKGYSMVHFLNNTVTSQNSIVFSSSVSQSDTSRSIIDILLRVSITTIITTDGSSGYGGAISLFDDSVMSLGKKSKVIFQSNKAKQWWGYKHSA